MLKKTVLAGIALLSLSAVALADSKIGAINIQKILADAPQAARAKKKIEKDFEVRDQELQRIAKQLKTMQENLGLVFPPPNNACIAAFAQGQGQCVNKD